MLIRTKDKNITSYRHLREENPNTSFPDKPTDKLLEEYGLARVREIANLEVLNDDEVLDAGQIVKVGNEWVYTREKREATQEEKRKRQNDRREAYHTDLFQEAGLALVLWMAGDFSEDEFRETVRTVKRMHRGSE